LLSFSCSSTATFPFNGLSHSIYHRGP
jgi:hypothetical protein